MNIIIYIAGAIAAYLVFRRACKAITRNWMQSDRIVGIIIALGSWAAFVACCIVLFINYCSEYLDKPAKW